MIKRSNVVILIIPLVILALLTACDTGTEADPEPEAGLDTVEGAILLLERCWEEADIDTYSTLFTDDFVFYFDDGDVGGDIPTSWGLQEELDAVEGVFERAGADNITLHLQLPEDYTEPEGDSCWANGVVYDLRVTIEDTTYLAQAETNFFLEKTDNEWLIKYWYDVISKLAHCTSWGMIKAYLR